MTDGERFVPQVHRVTLDICDSCLDGVGGECHVPGCALWMSTAPDIRLRDEVEIVVENVHEEG